MPAQHMIMPYDILCENQATNQIHKQTTVIIVGSEIVHECLNKQHSVKKV